MYSSACTSRCDELGAGQDRVAARHRQVWEASSSSFGVGPSGPSLCDECWSLARRFGEWDEPTPCGPCAAVFARVHFRRLLEGFRRSLPVFGCRPWSSVVTSLNHLLTTQEGTCLKHSFKVVKHCTWTRPVEDEFFSLSILCVSLRSNSFRQASFACNSPQAILMWSSVSGPSGSCLRSFMSSTS